MNAYAAMCITFVLTIFVERKVKKEWKSKFNKEQYDRNYEMDIHLNLNDENNKDVDELNQIKRCRFRVNPNRKEIKDNQRTRYG